MQLNVAMQNKNIITNLTERLYMNIHYTFLHHIESLAVLPQIA